MSIKSRKTNTLPIENILTISFKELNEKSKWAPDYFKFAGLYASNTKLEDLYKEIAQKAPRGTKFVVDVVPKRDEKNNLYFSAGTAVIPKYYPPNNF